MKPWHAVTLTALALGGFIGSGVTVDTVSWAHSQSEPSFDGGLAEKEYGVTDTGQILYVFDGTMYAQDERPQNLKGFKKKRYLGSTYVDVFKDGSKKAVTQMEYVALKTGGRIPKARTISLAEEALGAITNEAYSQADSASYANSLTLAIDCTETDRGVVTMVATRDTSFIAGVTHNGDAMTLATTSNNVNVAGVQAYSRTGADSGNNNVVVDLGSNYKLFSVVNVCLAGTDQIAMVEATKPVATGWGTSVSDSITTSTDGAWILSGINLQSAYTLTPDASETEISDTDHSDGNLGEFGVSSFEKTTAGSETIGWSWSTGDNHAMVLVAIKPSTASTPVAGGGGLQTIIFE